MPETLITEYSYFYIPKQYLYSITLDSGLSQSATEEEINSACADGLVTALNDIITDKEIERFVNSNWKTSDGFWNYLITQNGDFTTSSTIANIRNKLKNKYVLYLIRQGTLKRVKPIQTSSSSQT